MKIGGDGKNISTAVTDSGELKIELNEEIEVKQITSEKMILKNSDGSTTDVGETLKEHSEKIEENAQSIKKGLNFAGNHGTTNKQLGDTMSIKGKEGLSLEEIKDRKSTRLNSSHANISYAVFCLKKKKNAGTISRLDIPVLTCPH